MPKLHSETLNSAGDFTWLGSDHSLFNSRTETLDAKKFETVQSENGKVPSGYPVAMVGGKLAPYNKSGSGGAEVIAGHILTDQDASHGDIAVPVLDHGRVRTAKVPQEGFQAPAAQPKTTIIYL